MSSLYKFLPHHYVTAEGDFTYALIKAVDDTHAQLEGLIETAIEQLFLSTATGRSLIQLGEERGFTMPSNSGLEIRAFRELVPAMVSSPKQVINVINELLEIFYGSTRVRPSFTSTVAGPYALQDGEDLIIETESTTVSVSIVESQLSDINNVTADEIAGILNSGQDIYFADAITDRTTGLRHLRITSNAFGSGSFLRVVGGTLQNLVKMPKLISTNFLTGHVFNLSKVATYSDLLTFTWDGAGMNPSVFNMSPNDVVTIRGFTGVNETVNGSFEVVDAGYDYFTVRNQAFASTAGVVTLTVPENIVVTSSANTKLSDNLEFALVSETGESTATVTVPAVPPLARRFLAGSAHLHGYEAPIIDFNRVSFQINGEKLGEMPSSVNAFQIASSNIRYDFRRNYFRTKFKSIDPTYPTFLLTLDDLEIEDVFPYTVSEPVGTDVLYSEVGSDRIIATFPYPHGLRNYWGFDLSATAGAGNFSVGDLSVEQKVSEVIDPYRVAFKLTDTNGTLKKFEGVPFSGFSIVQHSTPQADGSDFYMQFASPAAALATGLESKMTFVLDSVTSIVLNFFFGDLLYRKLFVTSINGDQINFMGGLGVGAEGTVINPGFGYRSSVFGGDVEYYLDKTSIWNQFQVMTDLRASFLAYTAPTNEDYVGSYIYDPIGAKAKNTTSRFIVTLTEKVFKGSNVPAIFVDTLTTEDGEEFPTRGKILLDNGTEDVEGPISYFSTIENTSGGDSQILINPAHQFEKAHDVGSFVQVIHDVVPFEPSKRGEEFPVYLTGTAQARNTLFFLLESLIAAGVFLEANVSFPDLRYDDEAIEPFE